ncbi:MULTISPECIES: WD40/YVTN/BNR-like repeat-containing protein [Marinobacter]|uniref:WD40/YVTN/BNR-like repeat-containing protein n=1 Tax=Marinobacter TaxID=2742 RepID=UPI0012464D80|nr:MULTISPECIES: YCF48-related protein [Marinobacter]MBL3556379.1 glycosyl hydrolase [Marinobacter sp. JB05H06]
MRNAPLCSWRTAGKAVSLAGLSSLLLTGCEAPLNLEAVREQSQQTVKRTDFYQAMARNDEVIVLSGNNGVVLVSADNGKTWRRQNPTQDSFLALDVCPDDSFIALTFSNEIWHGDTRAENWTSHTLPSQEQMMTAACAPDGSWWAAGAFTTIQGSTDQGQTWSETTLNEDAILNNLQFVDSGKAFATGEYGLVLTTEDGGENWDYAGYLPDEFYAHASHFRSAEEGWVGGLNGFIYHTTDGGESWEKTPTGINAPIFGFVPGPTGLYALADNATVLQQSGQSWRKISTSDQPLYLRSGLMLPNHQLLAAGGRGLLLNLEIPVAFSAGTD